MIGTLTLFLKRNRQSGKLYQYTICNYVSYLTEIKLKVARHLKILSDQHMFGMFDMSVLLITH